MNARVFNVSIGAGVAMICIGVALAFSLPTALITIGVIVVGVTMLAARFG